MHFQAGRWGFLLPSAPWWNQRTLTPPARDPAASADPHVSQRDKRASGISSVALVDVRRMKRRVCDGNCGGGTSDLPPRPATGVRGPAGSDPAEVPLTRS